LSYSAAQNVRYHYRLLGFQNSWSEPTALREVTFNNLPPGDYTFEIYADAGTDNSRSETLTCAFSITPALWQRAWFPYALILLAVVVSFLISTYYLKRKNRALFERLNTERELNDLRIRSIRLRAIPHFNANVLVALEYYISNHSKETALKVLNTYSKFMYQTLSEVDKAARPLEEELEYVKMYLELEKLRYVNKFDYEFDVAPGVSTDVLLPNMLLHTYCENAVKHGLSPLMQRGGNRVKISVLPADDGNGGNMVSVSVEDNGVGRAFAATNRNVHSTKQGLDILSRQLEIYNRHNRRPIVQRVEDLYDAAHAPAGTRFTVLVPRDYIYSL
jgi:LytS/YehU family sensor histidine kinase